jgi:hypothetical protein
MRLPLLHRGKDLLQLDVACLGNGLGIPRDLGLEHR